MRKWKKKKIYYINFYEHKHSRCAQPQYNSLTEHIFFSSFFKASSWSIKLLSTFRQSKLIYSMWIL